MYILQGLKKFKAENSKLFKLTVVDKLCHRYLYHSCVIYFNNIYGVPEYCTHFVFALFSDYTAP